MKCTAGAADIEDVTAGGKISKEMIA